jgi:hypothetical protein
MITAAMDKSHSPTALRLFQKFCLGIMPSDSVLRVSRKWPPCHPVLKS